MKRKVIGVILALCLLFSLSGCMKINIGLIIEDENTYKASIEMLVDKEMMKAYGYSDEEIEQSLIAGSETEGDVEYESITRTIDGKEWVGVAAEGTSGMEDISQYLSKEKIDGRESLVLRMDMSELSSMTDTGGLEAYSVDQMKLLGMEMTLTVTMPGKVTANMGDIKDNTVTIDLLDLMANPPEDDELVISSAIGNDNLMLYIGIGAIVVAAVAIGVFILLKKKKHDPESNREIIMPRIDDQADKPEEKKDVE